MKYPGKINKSSKIKADKKKKKKRCARKQEHSQTWMLPCVMRQLLWGTKGREHLSKGRKGLGAALGVHRLLEPRSCRCPETASLPELSSFA